MYVTVSRSERVCLTSPAGTSVSPCAEPHLGYCNMVNDILYMVFSDYQHVAHLADRQLPTTTHPFRPVLDKYCVMGRLDKTSSGVSCVFFCSCVGDVSSNRDVRNDMELRFSSSRKFVFFLHLQFLLSPLK